MNCKDFKIWLDTTGGKVTELPAEHKAHLQSCKDCSLEYRLISESVHLIEEQKLSRLSDEKADQIIDSLQTRNFGKSTKPFPQTFYITKVAAVFIIALGILMGVIAGSFLLRSNEETDNPWADEFTLLSDNTEISLFE